MIAVNCYVCGRLFNILDFNRSEALLCEQCEAMMRNKLHKQVGRIRQVDIDAYAKRDLAAVTKNYWDARRERTAAHG